MLANLRNTACRVHFTCLTLMLALICGSGCNVFRGIKPKALHDKPVVSSTIPLKSTTDAATSEASQKLELAIAKETAELARKRGMDDEAISQYLLARSIDPKVRGIAHPLAVLYDRAGKMDAAEREYQTAFLELGDNADLLSDYGYFLYNRGKYDEAESKLRTALKKHPKHRQAAVNLALVLGARGNYDESKKLFAETIGPAAAAHNVGMLKLRAGDQVGAVADLQFASSQDPSLTETREVLAHLNRSLR